MVKKLAIGCIIAFVAICTISDLYYSKLERDYALLTDEMPIQGVITDYRVHWKNTYITVDSTTLIQVRPIITNAPESRYFHSLVEVGDSILKRKNSDEILLKTKDTDFLFINRIHDQSPSSF